MTEVPQWIWNQIAEKVPLQTAWARKMFAMNQDQVVSELNSEAAKMKAQEIPDKVIAAYQHVLPLWIERHAISEYVSRANDPRLRTMLPDLTEISEAVDLMTREYRLNGTDAGMLYDLLEKAPTT